MNLAEYIEIMKQVDVAKSAFDLNTPTDINIEELTKIALNLGGRFFSGLETTNESVLGNDEALSLQDRFAHSPFIKKLYMIVFQLLKRNLKQFVRIMSVLALNLISLTLIFLIVVFIL